MMRYYCDVCGKERKEQCVRKMGHEVNVAKTAPRAGFNDKEILYLSFGRTIDWCTECIKTHTDHLTACAQRHLKCHMYDIPMTIERMERTLMDEFPQEYLDEVVKSDAEAGVKWYAGKEGRGFQDPLLYGERVYTDMEDERMTTKKKMEEPTAEQVFASEMWRATDSTGLLVLG